MKNLYNSASAASEIEAKFIFFGVEAASETTESTVSTESAAALTAMNDVANAFSDDPEFNLDEGEVPKDPEQRKAFVDKIGTDLNFAKEFFADNPAAFIDEQGFLHPGDGTKIEESQVDFQKFKKDCFLISGEYKFDDYANAMRQILEPSTNEQGNPIYLLRNGDVLAGSHLRAITTYINSGNESDWNEKVAAIVDSIMPGKADEFRSAGSKFGTLNIGVRMELGNKVRQAVRGGVANAITVKENQNIANTGTTD